MYSQNQEEKYILEFFGEKVGNLLDVGANDGLTYSNSRALIEKGWYADLVEPSPKAFKKLEELYGNDVNVELWNYAITQKGDDQYLYESEDTVLSTLKERELLRWPKSKFKKVLVPTLDWKEFVFNAGRYWDFITIDAEGYDLEILRQIDLSKTQLLCIEWNSIEETKKAILDYTSKFKMNKILYTSGENLLICRS